MDAYFDSAIIVKLYVREATSPDAIRLVGAYVAPYWLTQWQALEVKNAIRLKAFRKEITMAQMSQSIAAFEQDIATGRWQRPVYSATAVEQKADELSASHSAILGCRMLDIIHVAAAVVIGAKEFVTFDGRQGAMAKQAGLTVKP
ncbi:MAG: type II toxin-antitoxin system VapC family toxin [Verrucomicrobiota bacterium]|jgi:predicted nucleic acid-binding protein